ncbi:MAG: hypothetical protein J7L38_00490 [Thermoproteales archaeon]|nr:hypothetical protein [Thermoproteales archaeon]
MLRVFWRLWKLKTYVLILDYSTWRPSGLADDGTPRRAGFAVPVDAE